MSTSPQVTHPRSGMEIMIDLHGYSLEKAKFCVLHVLAHAQNVSKIRVITGRGNHAGKSGVRGILYKELHSWLTESSYQARIEKVLPGDGYYEIFLKASYIEQKLNQYIHSAFSDLFPGIKMIKVKADQGDTQCQFTYAVGLTNVAKSDQEFKEAYNYFLSAAKNHHADAMVYVARCYLAGRGVKQNDAEGVKWLQKALECNQVEAPVMLGDCYSNGWGVEHDFKKAVSYYQISAVNNDPVGMRKLASAYYGGYGTKRDEQTAFQWYKKAADLGDITSQYNVATML